MQTSETASSKIAPVLIVTIGILLAAAVVYAARTSMVLRYEMKQLQNENETLKKQIAGGGTDVVETTASPASDTGKDAEIARLKTELEQSRKSVAAEALLPRVANTNTNTNRVSGLDRLRESDPERYKQITEAREQRRKQAETYFQEQFTRLDDRLKTAQTQEEADLVGQISDTLTKMNELRGAWEKISQLPEDQRRQQGQQLGQESWQTYQTYSQLREKDRQLQLSQLAGQIGYQNPKESEQFTSAVNRILKETDTSMNRMMGGMGFGRGGRGGGQGNNQGSTQQ